MSNNFAGVSVLPYIGTPFKKPVALNPGEVNKAGQGNTAKGTVPLNINWLPYWAVAGQPSNLGIAINLSGQNASGGLIDRIRTIKIDNTFSTVPIFVVFPDTFDVITCPPQTVVVENVISDSLQPIIYVSGLTFGFIPTTLIQVLNYNLPPTLDPALQITFPQALGSPTIQRTNFLSPGYAAPALGDQFYYNVLDHSNIPPDVNLWFTPRPSGRLIITSLCVSADSFLTTVVGQKSTRIGTISGANFGILAQLSSFTTDSGPTNSNDMIFQTHGNIVLDATDTWTMRRITGPIASGNWSLYSTFTVQP